MSSDPYSLEKLQDIVEPTAISLWSPANGFWFLAALLAVWLLFAAWNGWRRWRRNRYWRLALTQSQTLLAQHRNDDHPSTLISALAPRPHSATPSASPSAYSNAANSNSAA